MADEESQAESILELNNIGFYAQGKELIRDFSHRYAAGKTTALVGPSGGGKSTVLKLSAGLLVPSRGAVLFRGKDIHLMNRKENLVFRQESAVVFQDSALWANQSLYQILELPLRIHFPSMSKHEREARIKAVVEEAGYRRELGSRPSNLSMGEQKLIAFARAMLCRPELLFLDEWTESLDESASQRLVRLVRERQDAKHTIIFVSHNVGIIKSLADTILMIRNGNIFLKLSREQIHSDAEIAEYLEKGMAS
ncbi:MAG: ATP-binding cassette domain-containing protein [Treponema sp.]|jgi:ABC-type multidrug transport system ATPase subunit|nr:ATP-binding cassette domain-containing protein [Treponema sp.]